jgi:acyl-CoA thioesterase-1
LRRRTRRALLGAAAVPIVVIAVLGAEVLLARRGTDLPQGPPLAHDGHIGGPGAALRMVWLGDSTAAGEGATSADGAIPRRVAVALDRPVDLYVLAASGHRLADVLQYQLGRVAALHPDVVLVSVGANDVTHLTQKGTFHAEYERLVDGLPAGVRLVVLGVPDMGAPPRFAQPLRAVAGWRGRTLDGVARSVARERGAVYVDIAGETGPAMRQDTARYFAKDRYHPSDDGYRLWADAVVARLRPALATASEGVVHGHR